MATPKYDALIGSENNNNPLLRQGMIRDWANRDTDVLPDTITAQAAKWAADKCYRKLRVPALEFTRTFTIEESDFVGEISEVNRNPEVIMPVPEDLIDVIYIRHVRLGFVIEEKVDNRTYFQTTTEKNTSAYWTRTRDSYHLTMLGVVAGDELEIHYYRRLPALNATYGAIAANFNAQVTQGALVSTAADQSDLPTFSTEGGDSETDILWFQAENTPTNGDPRGSIVASPISVAAVMAVEPVEDDEDTPDEDETVDEVLAVAAFDTPVRFTGEEAFHWLRDENERILLFGALAEVFMRLKEPESAAQYIQLFQLEIDELNQEEKMRKVRGGNTQVHFSGRGLI